MSSYKKHKQFRFKNYDYSSNGFYFITFVTQNRIQALGKIENQEIVLSELGNYCKMNIEKFNINIEKDNPYEDNPYFIKNSNYIISIENWVIMPDHIHFILEIMNSNQSEYLAKNTISPLQIGSIGSFINHFKGKIKRYANENNINFAWQPRFHDRIIRDDKEYNNITKYIDNNIKNWKS